MSLCTVLGAGGYIGRHLVTLLEAEGHAVFAPERGDERIFQQPLGTVFYCIGMTGNFRTRPFETVEAHIGMLSRVLQHADFSALAYLSSTRVYQGASATTEETPLQVMPNDPGYLYNLTKLTGESLCRASNRDGIRIIRLSNVVGPEMNLASGSFISSLIAEARVGHIALQSSPDSAKDYIHIEEAVQRIRMIGLSGKHDLYNLARGVQTSHRDWIGWISARSGCTISLASDAPHQSFPPIAVSRLVAEFGASHHNIEDWLDQAFPPSTSMLSLANPR